MGTLRINVSQEPASVMNGQYYDIVSHYRVDNAITPHQNFPNAASTKFWNDSTHSREVSQFIGGLKNLLGKQSSISR